MLSGAATDVLSASRLSVDVHDSNNVPRLPECQCLLMNYSIALIFYCDIYYQFTINIYNRLKRVGKEHRFAINVSAPTIRIDRNGAAML